MIASARILQGQRERERQREMHEHKYVISKILLWVRNRISIVKKKKIKRHQRSNFTSFVSSDSKIHCAFNTQLKWPKELKIFYKRKKKVVQDGFKINQHLSRAAVLKSCSAALPFSSHKWWQRTGEHFPPHFPFLGMKKCQTWSWHVQLHQSVYVNRHQHATPKWFLYHDQTTCVCYSVSGTPSRSQGWLCQFPEISLMPIQAHCSACVYIWGLHTAARTHLISFCHSQHQLRVRVQSESNREPRLAALRLKKDQLQLGPFF